MLRVHILAKELGVSSKAIIEKCKAEGIELKNHMAAISAGLAESIREWFSVGDDVTSVEVAERVDLTKVQKPRGKSDTHDGEEEAHPAEPVDEPVEPEPAGVEAAEAPPPPEAPPVSIPEPAPLRPAAASEAAPPAAAPAPVEAPPPPEPIEILPSAPVAPDVEIDRIAASAAPSTKPIETVGPAAPPIPVPPQLVPERPRPHVPIPPPLVVPAGPRLVPRPAELKGPRVVRIEAPEPMAPRPRPRPAGGGFEPRSPIGPRGPMTRLPVPSAAPSTTETRRPRGKTGKTRDEEEAAKLRSRSPRRTDVAVEIDQRVQEWREQDLIERRERLANVTGQGLRERRAAERRRQSVTQAHPAGPAGPKAPTEISVPISIKDFCTAVGVPFSAVNKKLIEQTGKLWTITQSLEQEQVEHLALDLGLQLAIVRPKTEFEQIEAEYEERERPALRPRPPVVAMLGHVDHGKTSLLDAIRKTRVAAGEAGGITQHIGAYRVDKGDWHVTFLDTPGHEAFTAMRARGANLTDVVVLVVAADDGVMPQTVEAMNHARAAGATIVVALNKSDLPGVDFNRIYAQLAEHDLTPSEWGGQTDVIRTSATTGMGVEELIAHLSTLSELLELKADATVPAHATVIEAQMREGQGVVAHVLVREGTLRAGQVVVAGPGFGKVRQLKDDRGARITEATPGTPVEISGLDALPEAGDQLYVVDDVQRAKLIATEVRSERRASTLESATKPRTLEELRLGTNEEIPQLNVIVKADVQGSVDVLRKKLGEFPAERVRLAVLHAAVGAISEADVQLARASKAIVIGFHVVPDERARQLAEQLGVQIRQYRVIYEIESDLYKALAGLLKPEEKEEIRGTVDVRQIFNVSRLGTIAGCLVSSGTVARSHRVRLVRDGRIILERGSLGSLKRFKDDVREVRAGLECGLKIENFDDVKPGDVIQTYEIVEVPQKL